MKKFFDMNLNGETMHLDRGESVAQKGKIGQQAVNILASLRTSKGNETANIRI